MQIEAILLLLGLVAFFILSYYLNKKTPAPAELGAPTPQCSTCKQGCTYSGKEYIEDKKIK